MLGLPESTEFNRRIPKQKFYENLAVTPALKRVFVEQIKGIYWRNKIAPATVNLAPGETVSEIEIFEVCLNGSSLDEAVLRQMDREIPYHIVFLLAYEGKYQAWTAYKEAASGSSAFKVSAYYHTDWLPENELRFPVDGLNMDAVYENLVRQIAGDTLQGSTGESLKESVERDKMKKFLEKQVAALEGKIRREKQFNKQIELNAEIKRIRSIIRQLQ